MLMHHPSLHRDERSGEHPPQPEMARHVQFIAFAAKADPIALLDRLRHRLIFRSLQLPCSALCYPLRIPPAVLMSQFESELVR